MVLLVDIVLFRMFSGARSPAILRTKFNKAASKAQVEATKTPSAHTILPQREQVALVLHLDNLVDAPDLP